MQLTAKENYSETLKGNIGNISKFVASVKKWIKNT